MTTRNIIQLFIKFAVLLGLSLLFATPGAAQEPPADNPNGLNPRFGLVDAFANTAEANAAGAGWTRVLFRWDVVQSGGPSDWKPTNVPDTLINAEIAAGREVVAVLIGTPAWATDSQSSAAVPPREFWGDFVYKIASQYKGRINHWVIWNQPDITDPDSPSFTFAGSEEDYAMLLKEGYTKIKSVDPNAQVHLAGLTYTWDQERGNRQYLARLLDILAEDPDAPNNNYYFDAVSYHLNYSPLQMLSALSDVRGILTSAGLGDKPIWINETNAPPSEDFIEPPSASLGLTITLDEQAAYVLQAFSLALAGGAERVALNRLKNGPEPAIANGLLRADGSRRPAFDAFRTAATYFAGVQQTGWVQFNGIYVVTLNRGDQTTTVLWNTNRTPASYSLNAITPQATLVDERGKAQPVVAANGSYRVDLPAATCANGDYCFIGGAPRLIVEAGAAEQRAPLENSVAQSEAPALQVTVDPPLPPTATPEIAQAEATTEPIGPPTLTPVPVQVDDTPVPQPPTPLPTAAIPASSTGGDSPPPAETLPDPGNSVDVGAAPAPNGEAPAIDPFAFEMEVGSNGEDIEPTATTIPPVTLTTVFTPTRILWLLIIGLVVFTITYGIQVAIWYRMKR